jgi:hypothetical protein
MKVNDLKKELNGMGIEVVHGGYVRKKDIEKVLANKKPKVKAVLDTNTMKQGVQTLKKNKKFSELKKQYETLKNDLMGSSSFTPEEASSIINYAIHASADQVTNNK